MKHGLDILNISLLFVPQNQENTLRRRSFIAALPLAAVGSMPPVSSSNALSQTDGAARKELPKFQPAGAERFDRPDVHAGDRVSGASFASRSAAMGCSGAAGTAPPLPTLTAIEILKKGGSAIDAAIAANAVLGFVEPTSSGIGGDCYAMLWDPKLNKVVSLAGSGRSPKALTLETARARDKNVVLPTYVAISASVPGALDPWWTLHQRYGKLKWAELFEPAIHYCENGSPTPQIIGYYIKRNLAHFTKPGSGVEETDNAIDTYAPHGT